MTIEIKSTKHTQGPWEIYSHSVNDQVTFYGVRNKVFGAPEPFEGCAIKTTNKADALLIAAAPEMLEALKAFIEQDQNAVNKAIRAISKAEGSDET